MKRVHNGNVISLVCVLHRGPRSFEAGKALLAGVVVQGERDAADASGDEGLELRRGDDGSSDGGHAGEAPSVKVDHVENALHEDEVLSTLLRPEGHVEPEEVRLRSTCEIQILRLRLPGEVPSEERLQASEPVPHGAHEPPRPPRVREPGSLRFVRAHAGLQKGPFYGVRFRMEAELELPELVFLEPSAHEVVPHTRPLASEEGRSREREERLQRGGLPFTLLQHGALVRGELAVQGRGVHAGEPGERPNGLHEVPTMGLGAVDIGEPRGGASAVNVEAERLVADHAVRSSIHAGDLLRSLPPPRVRLPPKLRERRVQAIEERREDFRS